jgi:hypothetical protein
MKHGKSGDRTGIVGRIDEFPLLAQIQANEIEVLKSSAVSKLI